MTAFSPDNLILRPDPRLDDAGEGLLRVCYRRAGWLTLSLPKMLVLGLPTGGALVSATMAWRLNRLSSFETQKLELLGDWLSRHLATTPPSVVNDPPSLELTRESGRLSGGLIVATMVLASATLALMLTVLAIEPRGVGQVLAPLAALLGAPVPWSAPVGSLALTMHAASALSFVSVGVVVWKRREAMSHAAQQFNSFARRHELPTVRVSRRWWRWPGWNAMIVVMALIGPAWSAPMGLAGLLMLGYIRGTSDVLFVQFGESLRSALARSHAGAFVPPTPRVVIRCDDERCGAVRPEGVPYCPRCDRASANGRRA